MTTFTTEDRETAARLTGNLVEEPTSEIAKELGITKARVQQIETRALEKLRKRLLWGHKIEKLGDIL